MPHFVSLRRGFIYLVSGKNNHVQSVTNLHEIKDTPLYDQKVSVWCTILQNWTIGPIFFNDLYQLRTLL
jgi:hypothetical protein